MDEQVMFGLMALAKQNQETLDRLLAAAESDRSRWEANTESMHKLIGELGLQTMRVNDSAAAAARGAVEAAMIGVADRASETARKASQPLIKRMTEATDDAIRARHALDKSAKAIGPRMGLYALIGSAFLMLTGAGLGYSIGAMREGRVEALRQERAELELGVAEFEKRAGRAVLKQCGDKGRLCVLVDPKERYGSEKEPFMVIKGY